MTAALELAGLSVGYDRPLLTGVSLAVHAGEFVGLIGPNGAGKSTLMRAIAGELVPSAGQVRLFGEELARMGAKERARRLAYLPQMPASDGAFAVEEVVRFGRHPYQRGWGWGDPDRDARVMAEAMEAAGVARWAARRMGTLSGGEQQRVRLAQALAQEPRVLLLDEPTTWADLGFQLDLMGLVARLAKERGLAVVAVLHDLNHASQFCSRLVLVHGGAIAADGTPAEVLTAERVEVTFGVRVHVTQHPESGAPVLLPRHSSA